MSLTKTHNRMIKGSVSNVLDFGAVGDGIADDTTAIQSAINSSTTLELPAGTYKITATLTIPDNTTVYLRSGATISSTVGTAIRMTCSYSTLKGEGWDSVIKTASASTQGVVLLGHGDNTTVDSIEYNTIKDLKILGNDSFGAVGAFEQQYTVGLMIFSNACWTTSSINYYNNIKNIFIQDVKEGLTLAGTINANFISDILYWKCGQSGLYIFSPHISENYGARYGYNWTSAGGMVVDNTAAENLLVNHFVDTLGLAYDNTPGYASRTFFDGRSYPANATTLRIEGYTAYNQITNFLTEPAPGISTVITGYEISANTTNTQIQGAFNVITIGTNNAPLGCSIFNGAGASQASSNIRQANLYNLQIMAQGTVSAPVVYDRNQTGTGIYFPANGEIGLTSSGTKRLEVNATGIEIDGDTRTKAVYPIVDTPYSLGTASFRWSEVFAVAGTINTSDQNEKQQIRSLTSNEQAVAVRLKGLIKAFKFNSAVESKGDAARIHVGVIAQEVKSAFEAEGLDAHHYGVFCSDTWTDDDGVEQTRLGVRYEELYGFIISTL